MLTKAPYLLSNVLCSVLNGPIRASVCVCVCVRVCVCTHIFQMLVRLDAFSANLFIVR